MRSAVPSASGRSKAVDPVRASCRPRAETSPTWPVDLRARKALVVARIRLRDVEYEGIADLGVLLFGSSAPASPVITVCEGSRVSPPPLYCCARLPPGVRRTRRRASSERAYGTSNTSAGGVRGGNRQGGVGVPYRTQRGAGGDRRLLLRPTSKGGWYARARATKRKRARDRPRRQARTSAGASRLGLSIFSHGRFELRAAEVAVRRGLLVRWTAQVEVVNESRPVASRSAPDSSAIFSSAICPVPNVSTRTLTG